MHFACKIVKHASQQHILYLLLAFLAFVVYIVCIHLFDAVTFDISPPVSVGPSTLHTESSGVLDASASVTSISTWC